MKMLSENVQIVVGKLADVQMIKEEKTEHPIADWDHRAKWSFLRLQEGRSVDKAIHDFIADAEKAAGHKLKRWERFEVFDRFFQQCVDQIMPWNRREIQFILDDRDNVRAVASLQHLLIPPAEVYGMAQRIIDKSYPHVKGFDVNGLHGSQYLVKEVAGIKLGLQVYGGDITTRQAITVSSMLRVEQCFNPLSFLGVHWFKGFTGNSRGTGKGYERILRIKVKEELEPRLKEGIALALQKQDDLEKRIQTAQKVHVKKSEAEIIMAAMGLSYSLGAGTVKQVLARLRKEAKTQYGMSMASSWIAAHGAFKATPTGQERKVEQKLSTISAAALLLDDIKTAHENSLDWLRAHVREGEIKSLDVLLKKIGVTKKERKKK
jgi:hypothetical protein